LTKYPKKARWRSQLYGSVAWRKQRLIVLNRDNWLCQVKLPGCQVRAVMVDHTIEPDRGGSWLDPFNLRASCRACNNKKAWDRKKFEQSHRRRKW
jgi:5-methylcytosine-specific restriction endonuclease McrA